MLTQRSYTPSPPSPPAKPLGPPYRVGAKDLQVGLLRLKQLGHHLEETLHEEVDALAVTGHEQLVQRLHGDAHVPGESSIIAITQPRACSTPTAWPGQSRRQCSGHLGNTQLMRLSPGSPTTGQLFQPSPEKQNEAELEGSLEMNSSSPLFYTWRTWGQTRYTISWGNTSRKNGCPEEQLLNSNPVRSENYSSKSRRVCWHCPRQRRGVRMKKSFNLKSLEWEG